MNSVQEKKPVVESMLIDARVFAQLLGISKSQFYRMKARGELPAPIPMGGVKWRRSDVFRFIESLATETI